MHISYFDCRKGQINLTKYNSELHLDEGKIARIKISVNAFSDTYHFLAKPKEDVTAIPLCFAWYHVASYYNAIAEKIAKY